MFGPLTARAQELIGGFGSGHDTDSFVAEDEDSVRPQPLAAEFQPLLGADVAAAQPQPLVAAAALLLLLPHPDDGFESIGGNET